MPTRPALPLHLLAAMLSLAWATAAQAETSPYYIGASASANHDSNIFRLPQRIGDRSYSIGLLGGVDQPIGRQRFYASGTLRNNHYQTQSQLNNTSYGANIGLDWSTIEKLSGTLSFSGNSNLVNYGGGNTALSTARNIEKSSQTFASVQYGMTGLLSLNGSLTHRTLAYSDASYQGNGVTQDVVSAGINYRPSGALTLGTGLRVTHGEYANNNGSFNRRDLDLTAQWVPTGLSTLNTRLSFGRQTAEGVNTGRDFSGATGYLSWQYQPTGKLQFNTWISRDTGAESGFFNYQGQQIRGVGDTSQITNTLSVDASYAATSKVRVVANLRTSRRDLVNGALKDNDTVTGASLGVTYTALRNLQFSCNVGRESRSAGGVLSTAYNATSMGCSAQITLQ